MSFRLLPDRPSISWTPYAYLIYTSLFIAQPFLNDSPTWQVVAMFGGLAIFLVLYFRSWWLGGWRILPIIIAMCALAIGFAPINIGASTFFIFAAACSPNLGNARHATGIIFGILGLVALTAWWLQPLIYFWLPAAVFTPLIGFLCLHQHTVLVTEERLRLSQEEIARLAKVAERERIARDLHDLLGHTLSLITLKAELAGRLIERDPQRAGAEIGDVERIARDATSEVRHAVIGYRTRSIEDEITQARTALDAAGVELEVDLEAVPLDPMQEGVLSLALREAVTNVVRHASASSCRVRLDSDGVHVRLAVEDDGRGADGPEGSGLIGMRERVAALGGQLERRVGDGTRLVVRLPQRVAMSESPA